MTRCGRACMKVQGQIPAGMCICVSAHGGSNGTVVSMCDCCWRLRCFLAHSLRDELLDAAREMADEDEAAAKQQSLGAALQQALEQRLERPHAAVANGAATNGDAQVSGGADEQHGELKVKQEQRAEPEAAVDRQAEEPEAKIEAQLAEIKAEASEAEAHAAAAPDTNGTAAEAPAVPTPEQLELLDWHWANLEYGCSAPLTEVSLPHWNQDEEWGGFGGPHGMVLGGFGQAMQGLADQLGDALRLSTPVTCIQYSDGEQEEEQPHDQANGSAGTAAVKVTTSSGEVLEATLVLVTLPLGVLKQGAVEFVPPLPEWKAGVVARMGFGDLNKVVMQVSRAGRAGACTAQAGSWEAVRL